MSKIFRKIPFLRLSVALVIGIVLAKYIHFPVSFLLLAFCIILAVLLLINKFYTYWLTVIFGIGIHLIFFILGAIVYENYNKKPDFYYKGKYVATVLETPIEKPGSFKTFLKINSVNENGTCHLSAEKVLAYFEKQDDVKNLKPGDIIIFTNSPQLVEYKNNPFEFNYKAYLEKQNIYRQVYIPSSNWKLTKLQHSFSLNLFAEKTRMKLLNIYKQQNLGKNELEILSALTLGYKQDLDPEIRRVFASSGAMHILAVSGLHVGIIFLILLRIFGFLRKRKAGKFLFVSIAISVLWFYAFLTGLSPSVLRAATMFTFVVVGLNLNRRVNIYNSLAGSALFILLVNPNNLFEIGFQLSYAAVFGIVFLQPKLEKLIYIKYKFINYFWQLLTVSVAAQIATFPITILYFNQFPTYFWISNLFVIPAVMVLIPLGFSLLIFYPVPFIEALLAKITNLIIGFIYQILKGIESLPFSVQEVSITSTEFICIILLVFSIFLIVDHFQVKYIKLSLVFLLLLLSTSLIIKFNTLNQKKIIVYNSDKLMVHLISGKRNYIITKDELNETDYSLTLVKNTVQKLNLNQPTLLTFKDQYNDKFIVMKNKLVFFDGKTILVNENTYDLNNKIFPDLIINPTSVSKLPDTLLSKTIVFSENQFKSKMTGLTDRAHYLNEKGAFIKKW